MLRALYVTHPQVRINANVPVPLWGLSEEGRTRAEAFVDRLILPPEVMVFSSRERKALELAELLADKAGTLVMSDHLMGENDRSSTGFLPPVLFETMADRFFAEPERSADGWERACDAQQRVVDTVRTAASALPPDGFAIFCGHGAVGTLLKCHLGGRPIARSEDQSRHGHKGGGNCFAFSLGPERLLSEWTPMEDWPSEAFTDAIAATVPML
jgi:broad specificity phosphatase PhoE